MNIFDDTEIIRRYRAGDKEAFADIIKHYRKLVNTFLFRRGLSRDETEELTQQTFYLLFKELEADKKTEHRSLKPLVGKIVNAVAVDHIRHETKGDECLAKLAAGPERHAPAPDTVLESKQLDDALRSAVSRLPDTLRVVARLYFIFEYTMPEIAVATNLPLSVVSGRVKRARKAIQPELAEHWKGMSHVNGRVGRTVLRTAGAPGGRASRLHGGAVGAAAEGAARGEAGEDETDRALLLVRGGCSDDPRICRCMECRVEDGADDPDDGEPTDVC